MQKGGLAKGSGKGICHVRVGLFPPSLRLLDDCLAHGWQDDLVAPYGHPRKVVQQPNLDKLSMRNSGGVHAS